MVKLDIKVNWNYLVKGAIFAVILMLGTAIGAIMNGNGVQGFIIWGVVSTINVIGTIVVFYFLKIELNKKDEPVPKEKKTTKTEKNATESDKKPEKTEA